MVRKVLFDKQMIVSNKRGKNPKCSYTEPGNKRVVTIVIQHSKSEEENNVQNIKTSILMRKRCKAHISMKNGGK